ncbi:transposase [endosymbiont of Acanthamoeba sp. UWC8]|uniref:Rpn family recombination-promoting nuclease/putative transposase n=1 Tax=endosymbiont of Acanthamoeba sp. UWC8 TaxID=86106 RepID=UPI0004D11FC3|nr:Rpn family recombination-promoting nuclease/putative transposase [endosymbiont of Acanthamoeba sp. UWC8]AIF81042.1 transposase [endosymbiont of Acanthamoeba sp. UWC8]
MKPESENFLDNSLGKGMVDILFSVNFGEEKGYFYLLVEHQSKPDYWMPFRLYKYMLHICDKHLKKNPKAKHLPFVYPMIFYAGLEKYTAPLDLWSLFDDPSLAKQIYNDPFQLIEVQKIEDDELRKRVWSGVMEYVMKRIFARDILPFLQSIRPLLREISEKDSNYIIDILWYTVEAGESERAEEIIEAFKEAVTEEGRRDIMTIADRLIEKGVQQGIEKGMQQGMERGMQQGMRQVALNMLNMGESILFISKATGLSEVEINKLQNTRSKKH